MKHSDIIAYRLGHVIHVPRDVRAKPYGVHACLIT